MKKKKYFKLVNVDSYKIIEEINKEASTVYLSGTIENIFKRIYYLLEFL